MLLKLIYIYLFMVNTLSVTISAQQHQFLKETGFSPSKLLQQAINSLMDSTNSGDLEQLIKHERQKVTNLIGTIQKQRSFIENNNLMERFLNESA